VAPRKPGSLRETATMELPLVAFARITAFKSVASVRRTRARFSSIIGPKMGN
jgi:hypothetical protein